MTVSVREISVRSYLTAGTAAVVAAGAIALAPPAHNATFVPAPVAVDVALSATSLSFNDILGLVGNLGSLLPTNLLPSTLPTDLSGLISGLIPSGITNLISPNFINILVTEFVNEATGLIGATGTEVLSTLTTAVTGLISGPNSIPAQIGTVLTGFPNVLITSLSSLLTGNVTGALEAITTGLITPLTVVGQSVLNAVQAFQTYLTSVATNLLVSLPGVLLNSIGTVLGIIPAVPAAVVAPTVGAAAVLPAATTPALRVSAAPAASVAAPAEPVAPQADLAPEVTAPQVTEQLSVPTPQVTVTPSRVRASLPRAAAAAAGVAGDVASPPRQVAASRQSAKADRGHAAAAEKAGAIS